ncbi:hypothetical protein [Acidithiobacillus sp. AMEEHan]|uniref:hypothetical protein n=1 Tax=Acidithiobacillus sp. AMEEHan TaxID=2994951 RepID=UPI0027E59AB8|nr:hypothetical protein [Acidithiobacillus sp. AMEEHan]
MACNLFTNLSKPVNILASLVLLFFSLPLHAASAVDSLETLKQIPIVPAVKRVIAHPKDAKAIEKLVAGDWKAIATVGFSGILTDRDAPKTVLGKVGKIVLSGKAPEIGVFGWENSACGAATPTGKLYTWDKYEIPPPGYVQMGWHGLDESDFEPENAKYYHILTWNGKPLSKAQLDAATHLFPFNQDIKEGRRWLLIGFKRKCKGSKPEDVLLLEPTRGGMLVQYMVEGWILYERVSPGKSHP